MANFSKPTDVPNWADTGTKVDPGASKSLTGWILNESPPFSFFNFLQNLYGEWLGWIDERFFDGATNDDLTIKPPGELIASGGDNDVATFTSGLNGQATLIGGTGDGVGG